MRAIQLDLRDVTGAEVLHSLLQRRLGLPEYYGKNLDALYDCLSEIGEPTHIMALASAQGGAKCVKSALRVMSDAAGSNAMLSLNVFEL